MGPLQLYLASACGGPNVGLCDIGIEHALHMPIECPQSRDARELDRAATFGHARYQLRGLLVVTTSAMPPRAGRE
jgi:hypothetical protein